MGRVLDARTPPLSGPLIPHGGQPPVGGAIGQSLTCGITYNLENLGLHYEPTILFQSMYPTDGSTYGHQNACTIIFIVELFVIAPN